MVEDLIQTRQQGPFSPRFGVSVGLHEQSRSYGRSQSARSRSSLKQPVGRNDAVRQVETFSVPIVPSNSSRMMSFVYRGA